MANMQLTVERDLINGLPEECILRIFSFLPSEGDRLCCTAVCWKWLSLQIQLHHSDFCNTAGAVVFDGDNNNVELTEEVSNDMSLAVTAVTKSPRAVVELMVYGGQRLRSRRPQRHQTVTNVGFWLIGKGYPRLRSLTMMECIHVKDRGLKCIADGCPALEELEILSSGIGDRDGLRYIAMKCPKLSSLSIISCRNVEDNSLLAIAKYATNIESFTLCACPEVSDAGVTAVVSKLPKLENVILFSMRIGNQVLRAIAENSASIRDLCLEDVEGPTEQGYAALSQSKKLKGIVLRSCSGITARNFFFSRSSPPRFSNLIRVEIKSCASLKNIGLIDLTRQAHLLEDLRLESCNWITTWGLMLAMANRCDTLKVLILVECNLVGAPPQEHLFDRSYPQLEMMTLENCNAVTASFFKWTGRLCKKATGISLIDLTRMTDGHLIEFLRVVGETSNVVELDLSWCTEIGDRSFTHLVATVGNGLKKLSVKDCKNVNYWCLVLLLNGCLNLEELDLSGCDIGDYDLVYVVKGGRGRRLKKLLVSGCRRITDQGLSALGQCALDTLNVEDCEGITAYGIAVFQGANLLCDLVV